MHIFSQMISAIFGTSQLCAKRGPRLVLATIRPPRCALPRWLHARESIDSCHVLWHRNQFLRAICLGDWRWLEGHQEHLKTWTPFGFGIKIFCLEYHNFEVPYAIVGRICVIFLRYSVTKLCFGAEVQQLESYVTVRHTFIPGACKWLKEPLIMTKCSIATLTTGLPALWHSFLVSPTWNLQIFVAIPCQILIRNETSNVNYTLRQSRNI